MGLKVGIHTLRGSVSAAAIAAKSPILGTKFTVDQIATTGCSWNHGWFAVNMSHPASQPWLDSVCESDSGTSVHSLSHITSAACPSH
jgi:hypothetical protein